MPTVSAMFHWLKAWVRPTIVEPPVGDIAVYLLPTSVNVSILTTVITVQILTKDITVRLR